MSIDEGLGFRGKNKLVKALAKNTEEGTTYLGSALRKR
jgi:hypothetical protein